MDEVYVPYNGAKVVKVGGKCYELAEVVSGPVTHTLVEGEYETCEECEECPSSSSCSSSDAGSTSLSLFDTSKLDPSIIVGTSDTTIISWDFNDGSPIQNTNTPSHLYASGPNVVGIVNDVNQALVIDTLEVSDQGITAMYLSELVNLTTLLADNNNMSQLNVDNILSVLVSHNQNNGVLNLAGNTAPSPTGVTDALVLVSRGWTVTTD
jgi:hypothetical protein